MIKNFKRNNYVSEDTGVVFHALLNSNLVRVTSFCKYHHREWEGLATYRKNPKVFEDISRAYNSMLTIAKKSDYYNELYPQIVGFTMMSVLDGMRKAFDCEIEMIPRFCLDINDDIEIGAKIIIYGFGEVGKSVYRQMITEKNTK